MLSPRAVKFIQRESEGLPEAGGRENGELVLTKHRVSFGEMRKFWRWMVGMVAQQCEWINASELYTNGEDGNIVCYAYFTTIFKN